MSSKLECTNRDMAKGRYFLVGCGLLGPPFNGYTRVVTFQIARRYMQLMLIIWKLYSLTYAKVVVEALPSIQLA